MGCDKQILELVGFIYDAASDSSLWPVIFVPHASVQRCGMCRYDLY